jgi:hypothetical protein
MNKEIIQERLESIQEKVDLLEQLTRELYLLCKASDSVRKQREKEEGA